LKTAAASATEDQPITKNPSPASKPPNLVHETGSAPNKPQKTKLQPPRAVAALLEFEMTELDEATAAHTTASAAHEAARKAEANAAAAAAIARVLAADTKAAYTAATARADALIAAAGRGENVSARDLLDARAAAAEPGALVELHEAAAARADGMHRAAAENTRKAARELEYRADVLRRHRRIAAADRLDKALSEAEAAIAELGELGPHAARKYHLHCSSMRVEAASTEEMDLRRRFGSIEAVERMTPPPRQVAA
jgi:hypothetical protein